MLNDVGRAMREKEDNRRLGLTEEPELHMSCGCGTFDDPPQPTHLIDVSLHNKITDHLLVQRRDLVAALAGLLGLIERQAPELKRSSRFSEAQTVLGERAMGTSPPCCPHCGKPL